MTLCVPEVACIPLQAPDAVQLEVFVEGQVNVALDPKVIGAGLIDIATIGAAGGGRWRGVVVDGAWVTLQAVVLMRGSQWGFPGAGRTSCATCALGSHFCSDSTVEINFPWLKCG